VLSLIAGGLVFAGIFVTNLGEIDILDGPEIIELFLPALWVTIACLVFGYTACLIIRMKNLKKQRLIVIALFAVTGIWPFYILFCVIRALKARSANKKRMKEGGAAGGVEPAQERE
jgi:hypothetical protein